MSEIEILAKSGFLSLIGMATFGIGTNRDELSVAQQPTTNLMVIHIFSYLSLLVPFLLLNDGLHQGHACLAETLWSTDCHKKQRHGQLGLFVQVCLESDIARSLGETIR